MSSGVGGWNKTTNEKRVIRKERSLYSQELSAGLGGLNT